MSTQYERENKSCKENWIELYFLVFSHLWLRWNREEERMCEGSSLLKGFPKHSWKKLSNYSCWAFAETWLIKQTATYYSVFRNTGEKSTLSDIWKQVDQLKVQIDRTKLPGIKVTRGKKYWRTKVRCLNPENTTTYVTF